MPSFNAEKWIGYSIRSALAQTWPRIEVIVVDDGSTDKSLLVARQFESEKVKVLSQSNKGAASARNAAFNFCQGDYIQWLDADDLLATDKIALQLQATEHDDLDTNLYASSWSRFYYRPRREAASPDRLWRDSAPIDWLVDRFQEHLYMSPACWLMSRTLAKKTGPWDERLSLDDDGEFFTRAALASGGIKFVADGWSFYRTAGQQSLSNSFRT